MKKVTFVARLHRHGAGRLGFYVPTNVSEYYDLGADSLVKATMSWHGSDSIEIPNRFIRLTNYKGRLRGVLNDWLMPEVGTLVVFTLEVE